MTLFTILVGTLLAGLGSVWIAALLAHALLSRYTQHLLSLAAGALLATAFMRLLPEAFEQAATSGVSPQSLFAVLLVGVVFFFLLDKAELWHHGHEHHQELHDAGHDHGHDHGHGHDLAEARVHAHSTQPHHTHDGGHDGAHHGAHGGKHGGGWAVLLGDSVHAFGDGILIAAAFMADFRLGVAAALAVMAHEVPHHVGDLVVLRQTMKQPRSALVRLSFAGAVTALGGLLGYVLVGALEAYLPYFLVVAASSFIYVALADLIPQLQKRLTPAQTTAQVIWLFSGMALVTLIAEWVQH
jgi:zinc and cadmium transporter